MKKILYVEGCKDGTVGGSHTCLYSMVANLDRRRVHPVVVFYGDHIVAERLRGLGIETHVFEIFTPMDVGLLLKKVSPSLERMSPVLLPLQKAKNFLFYFLKTAFLYARYLKKHSIDILHLNNAVTSNHEWILAAKIAGVKVLTHERGINEKLPPAAKFLGKRLDAVICITKYIYFNLARQGLQEERLKVVYDGIDVNQLGMREDQMSVRRKYGIENGSPVIGVVGNIKAWKGQETAVRATAILKKTWPGIRCMLVGGTVAGDPYKEKLELIIKETNIEENVIFCGFQKNPVDYMNVMNVVVHSSIEPEPFGMVNLEAMYMKKPVVSTSIGGPLEIFKNGHDGILIEPGNPELLAEKISELLSNPMLRMTMGENAHNTVTRRFNISNTVNNVEKIYESVLG